MYILQRLSKKYKKVTDAQNSLDLHTPLVIYNSDVRKLKNIDQIDVHKQLVELTM